MPNRPLSWLTMLVTTFLVAWSCRRLTAGPYGYPGYEVSLMCERALNRGM